MSILVDRNTKLLVQGITGREGFFHTVRMIEYGTQVVAGVTPGKGGEWVYDGKIPVFDTVVSAVEATGANATVIFVPARFAVDAILEAMNRVLSRMMELEDFNEAIKLLQEIIESQESLDKQIRRRHKALLRDVLEDK